MSKKSKNMLPSLSTMALWNGLACLAIVFASVMSGYEAMLTS
jgi:hypothetical protein